MDGHVITLSRSLIVPFLQFSDRRDLRERAYTAWTARGANGGDTDNRAIAAEVLALRAERAKLLGYDTFADYKLETEMAGTPQAVRDLLMQVWEPARAKAMADAAKLEAMLHADGQPGPLQPWDWRYYAEKLRRAEHDLDEAALKPYLSLDNMIAAAFDCAHRLFGLEFRALDVPSTTPTPARGRSRAMAATWPCSSATISRAGPSGRARGVRPCAASASWAARCGPSWSISATSPRATRRFCPMTMRARCSTNSATRCTRSCRM